MTTIEAIRAHLLAGNEIVIASYSKPIILTADHVDYIRADGTGFRLGWPGKRSEYVFGASVRFVPAGMTVRQRKRRAA